MGLKEPFKVHSLSKHIEDTRKGLSADAQYNKRSASRAKVIKKEPGAVDAAIFGNNSDGDSSSSDSSDSSDDETSADFLKKLSARSGMSTTPSKKRGQVEEIADSDVERKASAKTKPAVKSAVMSAVKSAVKSKEASESSNDSSSESESEESEAEVKTNGAPVKKATSTSDDSSSDSESEEESDSESETEKPTEKIAAAKKATQTAAVKPVANGKVTEDTSSSSSEESESEEEEEEESEPAPATKKPSAKKAVQPEPESSSESEAESADEDQEMADESVHISERQVGQRHATPNFIAPDFVLRKGSDGANGQDVADICSKANLQGKQAWYFTVPANVPISVVQNMEIPMDSAQLADRLFSHEGEDYGVSFDSLAPKSSIQILIPSADGSQYQPSSHAINQTMQIKRITQMGGNSGGALTVGPSPRPSPRPQPKGLKARFQPIGVNTPMGSIGADEPSENRNDVEMADAPPTTSATKPGKKDKKKKESTVVVETPRKGKRKHTVSEDDAAAAAEQLMGETMRAETKAKKQKTVRNGSPDLGSEPSSTASKQETAVAPPTIPPASYSFSSLGSAAAASTPAGKKSKKSKVETPLPSNLQIQSALDKKQTPVPLPNLPLLIRAKESPVPIPSSGTIIATTPAKKTKAKKEKGGKADSTLQSSQQSPPPSAQPEEKKKKVSTGTKAKKLN